MTYDRLPDPDDQAEAYRKHHSGDGIGVAYDAIVEARAEAAWTKEKAKRFAADMDAVIDSNMMPPGLNDEVQDVKDGLNRVASWADDFGDALDRELEALGDEEDDADV